MIKAAVLGSPIAHSLSPLLHTIAYAELGIEGDYTRVEIKSGELGAFLARCDDSWNGFSLTMPLKEEVLGFTKEVSDLAIRIRSANTLVKRQGEWSAITTDVSGFTHALAAHGIDACGDVLIIGGGATARAAAAACDGMATRITVMNRSLSRIEAISNTIEISDLDFIAWDDATIFESVDLIISTTPEGASDALTASFPSHPTAVFFDVVYKPWPTAALATWSQRGGQIIDGLDLLIHQGIDQVALFSGVRFDRAPMAALMRRHALKALESST
ncbi:MAG: shikimate dehydrogenase [Candidatus Planktophila sp.]|nr:shikimate dehydrogenase [Candidatus Planktophila sp.]